VAIISYAVDAETLPASSFSPHHKKQPHVYQFHQSTIMQMDGMVRAFWV
jgi:hypothetical protein